MRLKELPHDELKRCLRTGLQLATGPFTFRITSPLPDIARSLAKLYGEFHLSENPFADFHVRIDSLKGPRRFYHPKVICALSSENPQDLVFIKELVEAGKIKSILDRYFPLEQAAEAPRYVVSGCKTGGVIITVENGNKKEEL